MHFSIRRNLLGGMALSWGRKSGKLRGSHPYTCFGLFDKKGIGGLLRKLSNQTKQSNLIYIYFCKFGQSVHKKPLNDHDRLCRLLELQVRKGGFFCLTSSRLHWASIIVYIMYILVYLLLGAFNIFSHLPIKKNLALCQTFFLFERPKRCSTVHTNYTKNTSYRQKGKI